jgi:glycosyltransferase involved in cell wall biosynthesis
MTVVSALVCTRDRPDSLHRTVRSLLTSNGDAFELIVIDQSDGTDSEQTLAEFRSDARLRYVRSRPKGKGASLNAGLRMARSPIVVCTDDDCEAPPGWAVEMTRLMETHPKVAVAFCNVNGGTYDRTAGYVPAYERQTDRILQSIGDVRSGIGLGAGMALRRDAVLAFGGFDESFGPGARFPSGDDRDVSIRALLRGWHVYETASLSVMHHGFRTLAEGREHAFRDWFAIGALCAKPIRAGYLRVVSVAAWWFFGDAIWPPLHDLMLFRRPSGMARIAGFLQGFVDGARIPVDDETLVFKAAG